MSQIVLNLVSMSIPAITVYMSDYSASRTNRDRPDLSGIYCTGWDRLEMDIHEGRHPQCDQPITILSSLL